MNVAQSRSEAWTVPAGPSPAGLSRCTAPRLARERLEDRPRDDVPLVRVFEPTAWRRAGLGAQDRGGHAPPPRGEVPLSVTEVEPLGRRGLAGNPCAVREELGEGRALERVVHAGGEARERLGQGRLPAQLAALDLQRDQGRGHGLGARAQVPTVLGGDRRGVARAPHPAHPQSNEALAGHDGCSERRESVARSHRLEERPQVLRRGRRLSSERRGRRDEEQGQRHEALHRVSPPRSRSRSAASASSSSTARASRSLMGESVRARNPPRSPLVSLTSPGRTSITHS